MRPSAEPRNRLDWPAGYLRRDDEMAKIHFYYSAMNAGKSTSLVQSAYNYHERGMRTLVFTPSIDTRYGNNAVTTRIGLKAEATIFDQHFDFYEKTRQENASSPVHCILIDEAQFITKAQVWQLVKIADELHIPVLTYGLRSDFHGELFEGSSHLLALADQLVELKTICHCGKKATMNLRVDENGHAIRDGDQVQIGGNDMYVSTCRQHFVLGQGSAHMVSDKTEVEV